MQRLLFRRSAWTRLGLALVLTLGLSCGAAYLRAQVARKPAQLAIVRFNEAADAESGERAIRAGLTKAGLVEKRDYVISLNSAQGDMSSLASVIDFALSDPPDILMPLQSVTLQTAVQRVRGKVPIVFHLVSDPIALGVAKSDTDHNPAITGAYIQTRAEDFQRVLAQIKSSFPGAKSIGTLFTPGEVVSGLQKDLLIAEAGKINMTVNAVPADTPNDLVNSTQAMLVANPDAIVMIDGTVANGNFPAVVTAAKRAHRPIYGFTTAQARQGAVYCVVPDVRRGGEAIGEMVKKIIAGEKPATIPLYRMPSGLKIINSTAARAAGLDYSAETVQGAMDVAASASSGLTPPPLPMPVP